MDVHPSAGLGEEVEPTDAAIFLGRTALDLVKGETVKLEYMDAAKIPEAVAKFRRLAKAVE
eukprot:7090170-Lingulodinium_polyedra.AAC.1